MIDEAANSSYHALMVIAHANLSSKNELDLAIINLKNIYNVGHYYNDEEGTKLLKEVVKYLTYKASQIT